MYGTISLAGVARDHTKLLNANNIRIRMLVIPKGSFSRKRHASEPQR